MIDPLRYKRPGGTEFVEAKAYDAVADRLVLAERWLRKARNELENYPRWQALAKEIDQFLGDESYPFTDSAEPRETV